MRMTMVSLYKLPLAVQERSYGRYELPCRKPGERYALLHIDDVNDKERIPDPNDRAKDKWADHFVSGEEIAADLMQGHDPSNALARLGFFLTKNEIPTEAELQAAEKAQRASFMRMVAAADQRWIASRDPREISSVERYAAAELNVEKEWAPKNADLVACPGCGARVNPEIAVHSPQMGGCGAILNREKAESLGILKQASAPPDAPRRRYTRRKGSTRSRRAPAQEATV